MSLTKWSIDPTHSEVSFKVKHLMISTVTGQFKKFNLLGETETDDFNTAKKIEFTADIDSIDTNNEQRDAHLKSADFFNAEQHSQILFSGTKYESEEEDGKLHGNLTIAHYPANEIECRVWRNCCRSLRADKSWLYRYRKNKP